MLHKDDGAFSYYVVSHYLEVSRSPDRQGGSYPL